MREIEIKLRTGATAIKKLLFIRRILQVLFLALWLVLFVALRNESLESIPPDLFLITDPLVTLLTLGAAHVFVVAMTTSLVLVVLTLVFGRVFCGYVCPMGTIMDFLAKMFRPNFNRFSLQQHKKMLQWKYYVLGAMLISALLSYNSTFWLDPLVLLYRGVANGIYPLFCACMPKELLPDTLTVKPVGVLFGPVLLLLIVLGLTALTPRFFCRYLCPLGALYGLLSGRSLLRRVVQSCNGCKVLAPGETNLQCAAMCRMGAVSPKKITSTNNHECIRCMACHVACSAKAVSWQWKGFSSTKKDVPLELSRRSFVTWSAMAVGTAPLLSLSSRPSKEPRRVIRPPRVLDEELFLDQCVRCLMCVQACPTQTLQPLHLEAGFSGLWTPALAPRVQGCKEDCNACSKVCPTEAIPKFRKDNRDKWAFKMGTAVLNTSLCIAYSEVLFCNACVKICPNNAITVAKANQALPERPIAIDFSRCVGCGLCEHACTSVVHGDPAMKTFSHGRGSPVLFSKSLL